MLLEEIRISDVPKGTELQDIHGLCPKCSFNFRGPDVRDLFVEKFASDLSMAEYTPEQRKEIATQVAMEHYGWTEEKPTHFSNIIGIEIPGAYDGVLIHQCPECETMWHRFTKKEIQVITDHIPSQNTTLDITDIQPNEELLNGTDTTETNERE